MTLRSVEESAPIHEGDKFRDAGGTWEVINVRPFGQVAVRCRAGSDRGLQLETTVRNLRERFTQVQS